MSRKWRVQPEVWTIWVAGGIASFVVLETLGYMDGVTLTSRITSWRDSHPLKRPLLAAALGATAGFAFDHLLHHQSPTTVVDRARQAGL